MHITKFTAENIKKLVAVNITPDGSVVVVGGKNNQGKTSVLDSIEMLLTGAKSIPKDVIRHGQSSARIAAELSPAPEAGYDGEYTVERIITRGGKPQLIVKEAATGMEASAPQDWLDGLKQSNLAFDPLQFTRLKPKEQLERLKEIVGVDTTELDSRHAKIYAERAVINREGERLAGYVDKLPYHIGVSKVDTAELATALAEQKSHNTWLAGRMQEKLSLERSVESSRQLLEVLRKQVETEEFRMADNAAKLQSVTEELAGKSVIDTTELNGQIATADETNRQVAENAAREEKTRELKELREQSKAKTVELKAIDAEKAALMQAAKWPVAGLGFGAEGITFNDFPFENLSSSQQLRVSFAMAAAQCATLKVACIQDGSLLDEDSMKAVHELAKEHGMQLWIEVVGTDVPGAVIIEEGTVATKKKRNLLNDSESEPVQGESAYSR